MLDFKKFKNIDGITFILLLALVAIGTIAVYDATQHSDLRGIYWNQIIMFLVFCIPMFLIALLDYHVLISRLAYILYGIVIILLGMVLFMGSTLNGATRWISIGGFQLQPSEMMKVVSILLGVHLLKKHQGKELRSFRDIAPIMGVFFVPLLLILKQPDLGTGLVFIGIMLGMLWIGNIRASYMVIGFVGCSLLVLTIFGLYFYNEELLAKIIHPHQLARIQSFLDPTSDPDKSWHVDNAILAIGSGQLSGSDGKYLEGGFIPYAYSDSIFVVIGHRYGFIGSSVLILLFFLLIWRLVGIARDSRDLAGTYLVVGVLGMFIFQIFVNIGMHIGLLPLTGISLPFISYGGSSMLTNLIAIGLALSVHAYKNDIPYDDL